MPVSLPRPARVIAEFLVIVVGVLVALAVDQWAEERRERKLEQAYLARLTQELERDTAELTIFLGMLREKEESLLRLNRLFSNPSISVSDPAEVLRDIATGTNFGWNAGPLARSATYDELRDSGNLSFIEDPDIRFKVVQYYYAAAGRERRIEARSTAFPHASYGIFLRARGPEAAEVGEALELVPDPELTSDDLERIVSSVRGTSLGLYVVAEINRARFIRSMMNGLRVEATALLEDLRLYSEGR